MRRGWCAGVVVIASLAAPAALADSGSAPPPNVVQAAPLPGDEFAVGPAIFRGRALWVEGGRQFVVRSLSPSGGVGTVFASSAHPGARGNFWGLDASSIAAGAGRLALVRQVVFASGCTIRRCLDTGPPSPPYSASVIAGPTDALRPVETVKRTCRAPLPQAVAVSRLGLVVDEEPSLCPGLGPRIVLRTFDGRLVRVLARGPSDVAPGFTSLSAAGHWAAFMRQSGFGGGTALIVDLRSGRVVRRIASRRLVSITVAADGRFALATAFRCGQRISLGSVRDRNLRPVATGELTSSRAGVLADGGLAYLVGGFSACVRQTAQVAVRFPRQPPILLGAAGPADTFAFDGRRVATWSQTTGAVRLTADNCTWPSVPVPADEPALTPGPTEIVTGLYAGGGPPPIPPCHGGFSGPFAGHIAVEDDRGVVVASASVGAGHLATIPVAPGTYTLSGSLGIPTPVTVPAGETVRQDLFLRRH